MSRLHDEARSIWEAGLRAVDARALTRTHLALLGIGGAHKVVAVGKAAVAMAAGARDHLGDGATGVALVHDGAGIEVAGFEVLEAGHPVPDARGVAAAARIGAMVDALGSSDRLLALISGGGSALLADPAPPLDLDGLVQHTRSLLSAGSPIAEVNEWRTAHATLKGGRMARRARPARVLSLVLCDVPGRPNLVASGPTAGTRLVEMANIRTAVDAAMDEARSRGWAVNRLPALSGEAAEMGRRIAQTAGPGVWIGGGECTVTVRGPGRGGRCQELALAAARDLRGRPFAMIAAGTDGRDGPTDAAGALVDGDTARYAGIDEALRANDAWSWLDAHDLLVRTGTTGTNVGDLVVLVHEPLGDPTSVYSE